MQPDDSLALARRCAQIDADTPISALVDFIATQERTAQLDLERFLCGIEQRARALLADDALDADFMRQHAA